MTIVDNVQKTMARDRKAREELAILQHRLSNKFLEWESWIFDANPPYFDEPRLHLEKSDPKKRVFLIFHKIYTANITVNLEESAIEVETNEEGYSQVKPLALFFAEERQDFKVILNTER